MADVEDVLREDDARTRSRSGRMGAGRRALGEGVQLAADALTDAVLTSSAEGGSLSWLDNVLPWRENELSRSNQRFIVGQLHQLGGRMRTTKNAHDQRSWKSITERYDSDSAADMSRRYAAGLALGIGNGYLTSNLVRHVMSNEEDGKQLVTMLARAFDQLDFDTSKFKELDFVKLEQFVEKKKSGTYDYTEDQINTLGLNPYSETWSAFTREEFYETCFAIAGGLRPGALMVWAFNKPDMPLTGYFEHLASRGFIRR